MENLVVCSACIFPQYSIYFSLLHTRCVVFVNIVLRPWLTVRQQNADSIKAP